MRAAAFSRSGSTRSGGDGHAVRAHHDRRPAVVVDDERRVSRVVVRFDESLCDVVDPGLEVHRRLGADAADHADRLHGRPTVCGVTVRLGGGDSSARIESQDERQGEEQGQRGHETWALRSDRVHGFLLDPRIDHVRGDVH